MRACVCVCVCIYAYSYVYADLRHSATQPKAKAPAPAPLSAAVEAAAAAQDLALLSADDLEKHGVEKRDAAAIADVLAVKVPPQAIIRAGHFRVSQSPSQPMPGSGGCLPGRAAPQATFRVRHFPPLSESATFRHFPSQPLSATFRVRHFPPLSESATFHHFPSRPLSESATARVGHCPSRHQHQRKPLSESSTVRVGRARRPPRARSPDPLPVPPSESLPGPSNPSRPARGSPGRAIPPSVGDFRLERSKRTRNAGTVGHAHRLYFGYPATVRASQSSGSATVRVSHCPVGHYPSQPLSESASQGFVRSLVRSRPRVGGGWDGGGGHPRGPAAPSQQV